MSRIASEGICRGEGAGYIAVRIADYDGPLSVAARTASGTQVPVTSRPAGTRAAGERRVALAVPLLSCAITVDLWLGDTPQGDPAWSTTFDPKASKVASRLLSTLKPALANSLRGIEERCTRGYAHLQVLGIWPTTPEGDQDPEDEPMLVWRIRATLPAADDGRPQLRVLGPDAEPVPQMARVIEDRVAPFGPHASATTRTVTFSARIPVRIDHLCLVCALTDDVASEAFRCLLPWQVAALREESLRHVRGAAWDARYPQWQQAHQATEAELGRQRSLAGAWPKDAPRFSIVVPVYRTPAPFLEEVIASVRAQTYPHWELILVNASGDWPEVSGVLARAAADPRVRVLPIENRSISENTNVGIAAATGTHLCFVDHDDLIEPDALWHYAAHLCAHPQTDLLYCDEDRIGQGGVPHMPAFKPDPNRGLLLGYNYVTHLLCVSRRALDLTARSGPDVSGAQDYDLTLRAFEVARESAHIPRVLYHWREHEASTAAGADQKPFAHHAGRRALEGHLARTGLPAHVEDGPLPCLYQVRFELAEPAPTTSIVVCAHDDAEALRACAQSVLDHTRYPNFEVVIAADGGQHVADTIAQLAAADDRVRVAAGAPTGAGGARDATFGAAANRGAEQAHGALLVFLDADVQALSECWLDELARCLVRPEVGVAGARLVDDDGLVVHAGLATATHGTLVRLARNLDHAEPGYAFANALGWDITMVAGSGLMVRREVFVGLDGFDESFGATYAGADLCLRARADGWTTTLAHRSVLRHRPEARHVPTTESELRELGARQLRERAHFSQVHAAYLVEGDPAINANLDPRSPWFELGPTQNDGSASSIQ